MTPTLLPLEKEKCQMTMEGFGGRNRFYLCGKPAKFWIPDKLKRTGWNGRQLLCGIHAHFHNKRAEKFKRPKAEPLAALRAADKAGK